MRDRDPSDAAPAADVDRRAFISSVSSVAMVGGLAAGYGTFAVMAGRYLYPSGMATARMFVAPASAIEPGDSISFKSPAGLEVVITRNADSPVDKTPNADDFLALSSICPHLGCRVHWEPHNDRFFCPCHNGAFDVDGAPIAGPPQADNQHLPKYPLFVDGGLLYIEMPVDSVGNNDHVLVARTDDDLQLDCGGDNGQEA